MARRPVEVQEAIDRGKLWAEFKKTSWYSDLKEFLTERIQSTKDQCVELTLMDKTAEAHAEAARSSGLNEVMNFIEGNIEAGKSIIDDEQAQRDYQGQIPNHVR